MTAPVWVSPSLAWLTARAIPKSATLTWPVWSIRTLPGLTSRWITPLRWAKVEGVRDISAYRRRPSAVRERPLADEGGKRLAVDVLHDDEVRVLALAPVVDRHDVGVGEVGCRLGFPTEPLDEGRVEDSSGKSTLIATGRSSSRSWAR